MLNSTSRKIHFYFNEAIGAQGTMLFFDLSLFSALTNKDVFVTWATSQISSRELASFHSKLQYQFIYKPIFGRMYNYKYKFWKGLRYVYGLICAFFNMLTLQKKYNLVYYQQYTVIPPMEILFVKLLKRLNVFCIIAPHDVVPFQSGLSFRKFIPALYSTFDIVILHSNFAKNEFELTFPNIKTKAIYIPHGHLCDRGDMPVLISRAKAREQLKLPLTSPILLFIGQIKEEKGLEILLQAIARVLPKIPHLHLVIAGRPFHCDITIYDDLITRFHLANHVTTRWEFIPEEELPIYYAACNAVVLPYKKLYQSGVALTSYAHHRPVIASNIGGFIEQVEEGVTGFLFKSEDIEALSIIIHTALSDLIRLDTMGTMANAWARERYNWISIADKIINLIPTRKHLKSS